MLRFSTFFHLMMNKLFSALREAIEPQFQNDVTGHDMNHIDRVVNMSRFLQKQEGGDLELIELSALLHDVSDHVLVSCLKELK